MLRHPSPVILAALGPALLAAVAGAQSPLPGPGGFGGYVEQQVSGYGMKRWATAEGLPHNWIGSVLQTRDGFLWLGTNNAGLVRFDGVELKTFNLLNTPAQHHAAVRRRRRRAVDRHGGRTRAPS